MTYRYVVYDLQKSFNQAFDDADITFNQILYWVAVVANRIRVQHNAVTNSDLFTSTFYPVEVLTDDLGRQYIDLPTQIMDLPNNSGIVYITYNEETCKCAGPTFAQVWFQGTNVGEVQHIYLDEYTKPKPSAPYFYRIAHRINDVSVNRIYLLGLECIDVESVEIAVKASIDPKKICNLDEEIPIPDERVQELINEVLKLGKFIMLLPSEMVNDGSDEGKVENVYAARGATLSDLSQDPSTASE
jgi:hypothetical protein